MDRCALFVDAGYLLADGAMAAHGTRHRETVSWDFTGLLQLLGNLARERTGLPLLRCYWYEATVDGRRTAEHDALADLPGIKLRLSRIRPGRREGVDTEIHRDLMKLARNNALADAVLVSGDEDLDQVITDAQDLGVRVTVVHVAVDGNWTISRVLRQECDDLIEIGSGHLRPYVNLLTGADSSSPPLSNGQAAAGSRGPITPLQPTDPHIGPPPGSPITGSPSQPQPITATAGVPTAVSSGSPAATQPNPSIPMPTLPGSLMHSAPTGAPAPTSHTTSGHTSGPHYSPPPAQPHVPFPGPQVTGPQTMGPQTISPQVTGPQTISPQITGPQITGPQITGPQITGPQITGPQITGPQQPPPSLQQGTPTLSDAVKAAHQEGQEFGESVARDAPALWLEAVLARKPRMPSDLEARLLQGSSLPIDFLLHDEVRHALRRGFWDALERSRR